MNKRVIPYGKQSISEQDIAAVTEALRSDWLTQGPTVGRFEAAVAKHCGVRHAVAVSNGTAALHLAALAAGFGPGDEIITSPITFVASANCIAYAGATPVFADIRPDTYCICPAEIEKRIGPATKGIIPVHFAGQPCEMGCIGKMAKEHGLIVIEDGAHAVGASYQVEGRTYRVGSCAHSEMTIFSFHPVKHMTTGEGGMITTNSDDLYAKLLLLRTHGITKDPSKLTRHDGPWYYEQQALGFNYRITDFQCALGISQLDKLDGFVSRRREIVATYNAAFSNSEKLILPFESEQAQSSWHLYMLQFKALDRLKVFIGLRDKGLGVNVHYIPVHLQPYYQENFGYEAGDFPVAEAYYARAITLPLFPAMTQEDVAYVINSVITTVHELEG
ncbi:UDP-4-amino-4,6-dideoxy-N-acetyl-beta-L-altrosamine transaminase [Geopsychrobacter electrodiphilus]|uniref:UDP-4-amino-4, 6-dideoxy-N-acetyl-beta-L-altrosamine transaminase n=1 Tax=Geopsychrobacter electrodiphilus TaxID=225196 RepID=UPI0003742BDF|nr:UDP-4-amino-4,6-dideoxy-N-acetyl-beta-L-altrosamine transaminase [Geopsychrobacter electrodiphilus]